VEQRHEGIILMWITYPTTMIDQLVFECFRKHTQEGIIGFAINQLGFQ
jgi:hypothetical protein